MLHPIAWVAWTAAVAVSATLTQNPFYLAILLGIVAIQFVAAGKHHPSAQGWRSLLRLVLGLALLVIPFNALNAHAGDHVLLHLPPSWPLIGGPITLEAVLWGASTALGLLVLLILFGTFNLVVDQAQILRLTPSFIYEAGLVVSIALTFVPQMMISAKEIREAQRIRGHRIKGLRDMLPLVVALLTTGLERSLQLAESMEARGFGSARPVPAAQDVLLKALSVLALTGVLGSAFALTYFAGLAWLGWSGLGASVLLLVGVFWAQGRRVHRTRYRRERWSWRDAAVIGASAAVLGLLIAVRIAQPPALRYYPYTTLLPPFNPALGALSLLLAVPLLVAAPPAAREPIPRAEKDVRVSAAPKSENSDDRVPTPHL
jgi:energy-coupling factor transport system permease protein